MGRGFGRGAKAVGIVTHAQVKGAKKLPKGLRKGASRKKKRDHFRGAGDDQTQLEESMGAPISNKNQNNKKPSKGKGAKNVEEGGNRPRRTLAQEIAGVQFPNVVNKRQKGFKSLRKQLISSVKDVRRRFAAKNKARARKQKNQEILAEQYKAAGEKHLKKKMSGHMRRQQQAGGDSD